jgi:hypothetical protein
VLKTILTLLAISFCLAASAQHDESDLSIVVQGASFSDPTITVTAGEDCAVFLQHLLRDLNYELKSVAGVQGPPGVIYTLEDPKREVVVVKCGRGGGCEHEQTAP